MLFEIVGYYTLVVASFNIVKACNITFNGIYKKETIYYKIQVKTNAYMDGFFSLRGKLGSTMIECCVFSCARASGADRILRRLS